MSGGLGLLWAALGSAAFSLLFDLRLKETPLAALGAALGWWVYSLIGPGNSPAGSCFAAAAAIGAYAEIVAVFRKRPAALYIVCSILPIVPGSGMYYTMLHSVRGDLMESLKSGFATLQAAGAIAAGLAVSSALSRLISLTNVARRISSKARRG